MADSYAQLGVVGRTVLSLIAITMVTLPLVAALLVAGDAIERRRQQQRPDEPPS